MTESSTTDPAPPSVQEDHTQVIALLNSADMQKRLQDARVQRAKILEARKSGLTDPSDLTANGGSSDFNSAVGPLGWDEASLILPAAVALKQPVSEQPHRQPQSYSLVIGLLSGLVLGSGMMWYSGFRFPAPAAAPDVAGTLVQQDQLAVDADGKDVEKIAADHFGVDPVPPIQASLADSIHTDSPLDLPLADQSPVKPDFGAFQAPQGSDRVPIRTASATAPAEADRPLPVLRLNAAIEEKLPVVTGESPPATHQRTTPILDAANATDQPPSMPIGLMVPNRPAVLIGAISNSATAPAGVPLQVALHLSPDLARADIDDARSTIATAGAVLVSTSLASFGVLQSEVRFFHQSDAQSAIKIAQDMRIKARDYSTFRPVPAAGTLEIWFAQGS